MVSISSRRNAASVVKSAWHSGALVSQHLFRCKLAGALTLTLTQRAGAFSILPCKRDGADLFTTDDRLKVLTFTGSPSVRFGLHPVRPWVAVAPNQKCLLFCVTQSAHGIAAVY